MSKIKILLECPYDFLNLDIIKDCEISNNPEVLIVNPGTDKFLNKEYFSKFQNLKIVGTPSTGVNHIDTEYLNSIGVQYFCLLDDRAALESITASAEFTWLHIMNSFRKFDKAIKSIVDWRSDSNESYLRSNELDGKIIGIVGLGRIGRKIKKYSEAFGMRVLFYDPYVEGSVDKFSDLSSCDILSINCYLTEETKNFICYNVLEEFKDNLIVVNTSRGEVVDESYVMNLIENKNIFYSTDVLQNEQNIETLRTSKLYNLFLEGHPNIVITPHVAGATLESQQKSFNSIVKLCLKSL